MTAESAERPSSRTVLLTVAYDGTEFAGWQVQPAERTVQGALEAALSEMEHRHVKVWGAGRTDAGVHARGQAAHFHTRASIPLRGYVRGLNTLLAGDVAVLDARDVPDGFHARFSALGKHYRYTILNAPVRHPLATRYAWHREKLLDHDAMNAGAAHLLGTRDFNAFRAASCERESAVREMRRLEVTRQGDYLHLDVEATAFLKHMVRVIVGTLVEVGRGKRPAAWVAEVLASRDRTRAGPTAPARGLCLERVFYPDPA